MVDTARLNEILDPLDLFGGQANRLAADVQAQLASLGLDLEKKFYKQLRADEAPVRNARNLAIDFLNRLQRGEATLGTDPRLASQQRELSRNIGQRSAALGKSLSGQRFLDEQQGYAQLESQSTNDRLNRILNLAGFQTRDLVNQNALLEQNTNSLANQSQNVFAARQSGQVGQQNAIFNGLGQAAGAFGYLYKPQSGGNLTGQPVDYGSSPYNTNIYAGYV